MKRSLALSAVGVLAACSVGLDRPISLDTVQTSMPAVSPAAGGLACRVGSNDGPVVADRGIGGTGAPQRVAERGIGGTGIVGVVTGFASICVAGLEVQYDASAQIEIEGQAASADALRAGQVVTIQADDRGGDLWVRRVAVRHEVAGRIEATTQGTFVVAGQTVALSGGTWGSERFRSGDWVAVSGLRRADGTIVASRLDPAPSDRFELHGPLSRDGNQVRIGSQALDGPLAAALIGGQTVTVTGFLVDGHYHAAGVTADAGLDDPFFGSSARHLVVQAFARVTATTVSFNGVTVPLAAGASGLTGADGAAVVLLERQADGSFRASGLRPAEPGNGLTGGSPVVATVAPAQSPRIEHRAHQAPVAVVAPVVVEDAAPNLVATPVPAALPAEAAAVPAVAAVAPEVGNAIAPEADQGGSGTSELMSGNPVKPGPAMAAAPARAARGVKLARAPHRAAGGGVVPPTISLSSGAVAGGASGGPAPNPPEAGRRDHPAAR